MKPQTREILDQLRYYGAAGVTQQDAIRDHACYRLAARISELRAAGYIITCDKSRGYGRYVLEETEQLAVGL